MWAGGGGGSFKEQTELKSKHKTTKTKKVLWGQEEYVFQASALELKSHYT